ncbi:DUF547 domain-containing protein [Cryomorpha ignava]|uniref:DUF547 domain-containing protein n=2 Tax=Cryomorpha ignava TaxID=101383 RepID=A0A7K3WMQ1_9FLAO|nr:DUF547 domain-containing protein [Cryomorpha ignava]
MMDSNSQTALSNPVDHSAWDALLKKHVNDKGLVNYKAMMKDSVALNKYLDMLSVNVPDEDVWTDAGQLAYWINAYNAFTVKLILNNYPVKSIKDIAGGIPFVNTPWDVKFIKIGDETYDLNNIEHGIIRKQFDEERIHFAVVCAAMSCPRLRNEAYTAEKLNAQLDDQARTFFNDESQNKISKDQASISPILKWYGGDFKDKAPSLREYVNQYSKVQINQGVDVGFTDYDWALNEQK